MNKVTPFVVVLASIALVVIMAVIAVIGSYVSWNNYGVAQESRLRALLQDNQNVLGQYTIRISEMAQVPDMYRDDLKEVIQATFQGRYGADGSRGVMQWIQEQNLPLDPQLYNRLQQSMESGRMEFANKQTALIDARRSYEANLNFVWSGFWLRLAGFPKVDLDDFNPVVAANTQQIFDTGVDTGVQLRPRRGVE